MEPSSSSSQSGTPGGNRRLPPNLSEDNFIDGGTPSMIWRKRLKALIVDSKPICRKLKDSRKAHGVHVLAVGSGSVALDVIYAGGCLSLIVINTSLHGMDGIEAARWLRVRGVTYKIVAVSPHPSQTERAAFLEAGGDIYLEKPFLPEEFVPILQELDNQS